MSPINMFLARDKVISYEYEPNQGKVCADAGTVSAGGECDEYAGLSWVLLPEFPRDEYFDWGWFFGDFLED